MGGMCAALFAALHGLRPLLCEKTDQVGGTTATSAGSVWIAGARDGDDPTDAARYLDAEIGERGERGLREAFLESGRAALELLQARTEARFRPADPHPDYHPNSPGWSARGRALAPLPFDGRRLGADFARVRPPIAPFMVLGGLMLGRDDIPAFVRPFASLAAFSHVARVVFRHLADRLAHPRGTRLLMGNALVARLLFSLRRERVPIAFGTRLVALVGDADAVEGAVVETQGIRRRIRARRGVVLATGGFSHDPQLRASLLPESAGARSVAFEGDSGDGIAAARALGAALAQGGGPAFWMPVSVLREGGRETVFPHIVLDRAKPGLIAVNSAGRRFANESASYHDFVEAMFAAHATTPSIPAWLVCDRAFLRDYGLGLVHPRLSDARIRRFVAADYLRTGATLAELASLLAIDPAAFADTVERHNRAAAIGVDEAFGKGGNPFNRHNGDPANAPNPCLRPIRDPPFFAVAVYPADLGTSAGLRTDRDSRVLRADGRPIAGLYACGNDMSSIMAGVYPGPGITLGPALAFAYRAMRSMATAA